MAIAIRAAESRDFQAIYAINQNAIPDVSSVTLDELQSLAKQCCYFGVAVVDGEVAGFLMALRPGQSYQSLNYRWFSEHYENFVYIDRIAVAPAYKGRGIGRALYADVESLTATTAPILTCEVNLVPPNAESMAFHTKLGFAEVGQQVTEDGTKRVSLMVKTLAAAQARL
jgi:predicted GNAT superfamily acetyltransferase